jgi:uncharacterized protein YyaL (SSP411 family)
MADTPINWTESLDEAKAKAAETGKPIFLFLYAVG